MRPARRFHACVLRLLAVAALCCPATHQAATPESWKSVSYGQAGAATTLQRALEDFARSMGLRLRSDADLSRLAVQPGVRATTPAAFLDDLATQHAFDWFVYAGVLHVSSSAQMPLVRLELRGNTASALKEALIGLGLFEPKFGWGELSSQPSAVLVSGPAAYLDLIGEVVRGLPEASSSRDVQLMVFPLKYASAADSETTVRERTVQLPGVASILREVLSGSSASAAGPLAVPRAEQGADAFKAPIRPLAQLRDGASGGTSSGAFGAGWGSGIGAGQATVRAFAGLNAVIVRDAIEKKAMYETLIASLDVPMQQVEVFANVVDVQSGTLRDWAVQLGLANSARTERSVASSRVDIGGGDGATLLWDSRALSLRLRALEAEGKARYVARPSVMTLNNQAALLDLSKTVYVKLEGERAVDVKAITVGSLLNVVPRVIVEADGIKIRLNLSIEDGLLDLTQAMPQATRNVINTQAIVNAEQALVIGGYRNDSKEDKQSRVPVLGALPLVGALFRSDHQQDAMSERIYIISARLVSP